MPNIINKMLCAFSLVDEIYVLGGKNDRSSETFNISYLTPHDYRETNIL